VDGEGSIGIAREHDRRKPSDYIAYRTLFQIVNTDLGSLEFTKGLIGAGILVSSKSDSPRHKPRHHYSLRDGKQIAAVCSALLPYLRIKRLQADTMVSFLMYRGRRNLRGWYRPRTFIDDGYYLAFRYLNARGPKQSLQEWAAAWKS
jgi:hypothetical protein